MSRQAVIAIGIVILLAAVGWWLWPGAPAPDAASEEPTEPVEEPLAEPAEAAESTEPTGEGLPPLSDSDGVARDALRAAGADSGALAGALSREDLVRRFTAAVAAVSRGLEPRSQLRFLGPEEPFRVTEQERDLVIDPRSFRRYDGVARAFGGLDAAAIGRRYERLEPLFEEAWRNLGETGDFRAAVLQAIDLLVATPVPEPPIEVRDEVSAYAYVDETLQDLSPAQKALLRFGPDNQRIVRDKLQQIRGEIGPGG